MSSSLWRRPESWMGLRPYQWPEGEPVMAGDQRVGTRTADGSTIFIPGLRVEFRSALEVERRAAMMAAPLGAWPSMKRDMELVRRILEFVRDRTDLEGRLVEFSEPEPVLIAAHVEMLFDAGLLDAFEAGHTNEGWRNIYVRNLTWNGHEYLSSVYNDTAWGEIKQSFTPAQLGTMSLKVIGEIGYAITKSWALEKLGLPAG